MWHLAGPGPLHANALARLLGCYPVVVPGNPGVLSALGFLEAEFKNEVVRTLIRAIAGSDDAGLRAQFAELQQKAQDWLEQQNIEKTDQGIAYSLDLRYEQQGFEVTIPVPEACVTSDTAFDSVFADFHETHERLYGVRFDLPIELVALRAVATGATPPVQVGAAEGGTSNIDDALIEMSKAYFQGEWLETKHIDRDKLAAGARVEGPAIIRQYDTTTVLLPGHHADVDNDGNLIIWPTKKGK